MGDKRNIYKSLVRKLERKRSFGTLDIDTKIILKGALNKYDMRFLHLAQKMDQWWTLLNI
jgi:hypothetical protein